MKTTQVLKSSDRVLFGVTIKQDTKHLLSVTDLQKAYETARWQYGWAARHMEDIMRHKSTQERLYYLLHERGLINMTIHMFMEMVENEGITRVLKGLKVWKTSGRGTTKSVSCDPYIWMLLAMELNPMIYAKVVIWLTDSLIFDRIEAGDEFRPMTRAISSVVMTPDYGKFSRAMNTRVFGYHQTGMRNLASATHLRKIADIEKFIVNAIEQGLLKNEDSILAAIQNYK